ncbi:hypothetical protein ISF6_2538 [Piscinibacter sakaiensis]|uniref:Uncharacterized protein n=1 Tax=Piscinibacter sakaiensis TaxID=1547922 RepID=A0A0K8P265_PISS1|nr:hypothetical protein ISF6_2538 [Piscinibacter sakaiensis]
MVGAEGGRGAQAHGKGRPAGAGAWAMDEAGSLLHTAGP